MANVDDKFRKVLFKLISATAENRLVWELQSGWGGPDRLTTSLPSSTINVTSRDGDGLPPYSLEIRNENGQTVEEITTPDQISPPGEFSGVSNDYLVQDLYQAARRQTVNAEQVLDRILLELEEPPF